MIPSRFFTADIKGLTNQDLGVLFIHYFFEGIKGV